METHGILRQWKLIHILRKQMPQLSFIIPLQTQKNCICDGNMKAVLTNVYNNYAHFRHLILQMFEITLPR